MAKAKISHEISCLAEVGRALRNKRLDLNISLQEAQKKSGISYVTISKIEKGELENCSLITLGKIASVYKMKINLSVTLLKQQ